MADQELGEAQPNEGGERGEAEVGGQARAAVDPLQFLLQLQAQTAAINQQLLAALQEKTNTAPVVQVHVAPQNTNRLKIFTGLPPTSKEEVTFPEWEAQVDHLLQTKEVGEIDQRVRASLKGLAFDQVKDCSTATEMVKTLQGIFGTTLSGEDLYQSFLEMTMLKKEPASAFLLRLWSRLVQINKTTKFTEEDLQCKLYRAFQRGLSPGHRLLSLELRTKFGFPGTAKPAFADLLRVVRQLEEPSQHPSPAEETAARCLPQQASMLSEQDLEAIVTKVTERLKGCLSSSAPVPSTPAPRGQNPPRQRKPRGRCYNCGELDDHFARECPNGSRPERGGKQNLNGSQSR